MDYTNLAYYLGNLFTNKRNLKLVDKTNNIKIYTFFNYNTLIVLFVNKTTNKKFFIKNNTKLEDIMDQCYSFFQKCGLQTIDLEETDFEELKVTNVKNIYITLLTEDNIEIIIDENFIDEIPSIGDVLDKNFKIKK